MKQKPDRRPHDAAPGRGPRPGPPGRGRGQQQWRIDERPQRPPTTDLLFGRNAIREALQAKRRRLRRLMVAEGVRSGGPIAELGALAQAANVPLVEVERRELDDLTDGANHQGVVLEAGLYPYADIDQMLALAQSRDELPLLLMLDHVQDPQNVGTLLRTADVVGAHGIILPDRRAASITPAVVNASAGAVEHLLIAEVANLTQAIEELKEHNVWIGGLEDDPRSVMFDSQRSDLPLALVVGAEGPGLSRLVRERCDFLLKLPMAGHVASLNAATAGSIALYSLWRRRAQA